MFRLMVRLGVFSKTTCELCSNKIIKDVLVAKAKEKMIKSPSDMHVRGVTRSAGVSSIKPQKIEGQGFPIKKDIKHSHVNLALAIKRFCIMITF